MDNNNEKFDGEGREEEISVTVAEEAAEAEAEVEVKTEEVGADVLLDEYKKERGYTPCEENAEDKDGKRTKTLLCRIGVLLLALAVAFSGSFFATYFVCRTSLLGDSEFFAAFMAKWAGVTENRVEVDYISGEYRGDNIDLAEKILNSTLIVRTVSKDDETGDLTPLSQGSGVVYSAGADGVTLAVTNYHVIENGGDIMVETVAGDRYYCTVKAMDISTDLAILQFTSDKPLAQPSHADSSKLKAGQSVAVAGNPLGHGFSVAFGYIAAPKSPSADAVGTQIQLDVSVNPGNSGGGVFDSQGNLIGVVVSKASGDNVDGLGYAIPINKVNEVVSDLLTYGYVQGRPALGITVRSIVTAAQYDYYSAQPPLSDHLKETDRDNYRYGVYIVEIREGNVTPLKVGDRIVSIDGIKVVANESISNAISKLSPGTAVKVTVERYQSGEYIQVTESVVLGSRNWADEMPEP